MDSLFRDGAGVCKNDILAFTFHDRDCGHNGIHGLATAAQDGVSLQQNT